MVASVNPGLCQACKGGGQGTEELVYDEDIDKWLCRECTDTAVDYKKMVQRYLVWHDSKLGRCFGSMDWSTIHQADTDARLYRADGYDARVVVVRIVDGQPVARWADQDG